MARVPVEPGVRQGQGAKEVSGPPEDSAGPVGGPALGGEGFTLACPARCGKAASM